MNVIMESEIESNEAHQSRGYRADGHMRVMHQGIFLHNRFILNASAEDLVIAIGVSVPAQYALHIWDS